MPVPVPVLVLVLVPVVMPVAVLRAHPASMALTRPSSRLGRHQGVLRAEGAVVAPHLLQAPAGRKGALGDENEAPGGGLGI